MASLVPGYDYDIFISYRQKDNKYDGWVTEFVENLKKELEATFKEEISLYFDINPHDGLLETHDVDESLKEKLRCLVFIPIISRTYCDPNSFAWEHEFKAFVERSRQDQYGLKIKLPGGNVAGRVLPVRIYDLDPADIKLCESVLEGGLRSVDFIYKSPGVNRPLRAVEDHPQDNLNKTYYRDQINKLANFAEEIITALRHYEEKPGEVLKEVTRPAYISVKGIKSKKVIGSIIVLAFILIGLFFGYKLLLSQKEIEKSIAVLPFQNDSPEVSEETTNFINGLMDELISNLQRIKELRVLGRNSVEQYRNNLSKSNPDIARQLGVTYIVEGSGQKYGNSFSLRVRLINAKGKEALIWTKSYEQEIKGTKDIFAVPSQISQTIASELKTVISPEEKLLIEKTSTTNIDALYFYQKGNEAYRKYLINNSEKEALTEAGLYYKKSLNYDSTFARAYTGLAGVYWGKHFIEEYLTKDFMDSVLIYCNIALGYDDQLAEAYLLRGDYHRERIESKQALKEYDKALNINPNFWQAYSSRASLYYLTGDYDKAYENAILAIKLNRGPELPVSLLTLGLPAMHYGFFNEAKYFLDEALKLNGDSAFYLFYMGMLEMYQENFKKAIEYDERSYFLDSTQSELLQNLGNLYWVTGQKETALQYYKKYISRSETFKSKLWFEEKTHSIQAVHRLGYCYWITGQKDKAEYYFDEQKRICEESIKLNREYGAKAYYDLAGIYAIRGEKEKAYQNLHLYAKESGENHTYAMLWYLKYDPFFDSLRDEPEFQEILTERKARYQESHEKLRKWLKDQGII